MIIEQCQVFHLWNASSEVLSANLKLSISIFGPFSLESFHTACLLQPFLLDGGVRDKFDKVFLTKQ